MSRIFSFIPARGGSERIADKNLQTVGDTSLVERAIECAWAAHFDSPTPIVSTDSDEIAKHVKDVATVTRRPAHVAGPHSQIEDAIRYWMQRCDPVLADDDVILLLQPTSPFRKPSTVQRCAEIVRSGYDSVCTVTLSCVRDGRLRSHQDGTLRALWNTPIGYRPRSQEAQRRAIENGAVYAFSAGHFRRTRNRLGGRDAVVETTWLEAFEIDTPEELEAARVLAPLAAKVVA